MATYTATVPSSWSREETFAFMADFRNVAQWDPSIDRCTLVSGTPGAVGARYEVVMKTLGKETAIPYEAVEVAEPSRIVMRGETGSIVSLDTITVAADGAVTYNAELELKGVRKVADPLAQVALTRASDKARDGLRDKLAT